MGRFRRRVSKLEHKLEGLGDIRLFRDLRRHIFNLTSISDAALIAAIRADIGEIELPDWAAAELEAPIPADAPKDLVRQASREAAAELEDTRSVSDKELEQSHGELMTFVTETLGLTSPREAQWLFEIVRRTGDQYGFVHTAYKEGKYPIPEDYP